MQESSQTDRQGAIDYAHYEDVTAWSRRAGIPYAVLVEPALRAKIDALVSPPVDPSDPHVPLFHLLVPLRFVLGRNRTACRFGFVVGRRLCEGGVAVWAEFCRDDLRGYFLVLSSQRE